ncbi:MAG: hypothetical protein KC897_02785 [Candidatus Omnitrophica bacterium]|nr:hypothetical protein [Candidatus Omnitrophota bacterium]MCB9722226.1 hypothetical protein [Candidatus Omnitrophota bacterium]
MTLELRKKYSLRVGDHKIVLLKKAYESEFHVLAKALVYALYLPVYPDLTVEKGIEDRYKPDAVALDAGGSVIFWAECGAVKPEKVGKILHKFRRAHFVFVKQPAHVRPFIQILEKIVRSLKHPVRAEVIAFPDDFERFIDAKGYITIGREDCQISSL